MDVANDLLSKCHISLRLAKVTDCGANVFVALYQAILGEKVPGNYTQVITIFNTFKYLQLVSNTARFKIPVIVIIIFNLYLSQECTLNRKHVTFH